MVRPLALTTAGRKRLLKAIETGNTRDDSARAAGITPRTLYNYLAAGRRQNSGPHFQLLQAVKKAENKAVLGRVGIISAAAKKSWQAAAWWLERRRSKDWAKRDKHELSGPKGGPLVLNIVEEVVDAPDPGATPSRPK